MRTTRIGSLEVSVIGLGCNNFGRGLDEAGAAAVVRAAVDAGITFFDTSSNYGGGRSEELLGRALGNARDRVVVATKFGVPVPGMDDEGGAAPAYLNRMIERSLRQLGTDHVDLYMLHRPDPRTPIADTLEAMSGLVEAGKVREIGCSNLDTSQLDEALDHSEERSLPRFVSNQLEYSLVSRGPEVNGMLDLCRRRTVALLPYYPLASGLLTGKVRRGEPPVGRLRMDRYQGFLSDANFDVVEALVAFAERQGVTPAQVALGWLLAHDEVPSVTPGAMSPDQVRANAGAGDWQPDPEALAELSEIAGRVRS